MPLSEQSKIAIIKRFLTENSTPPLDKELSDEAIKTMPLFNKLGNSLDQLADFDPVIHFATLNQDVNQWQLLTQVLKSGLDLRAGSPPTIEKVDYPAMRATTDRHAISLLPQPDYYQRVPKPNPGAQQMLDPLIDNARTALGKLLKTYPEFEKFDPKYIPDIQKNIEILKGNIKIAESVKDDVNLKKFTSQLTLLEDLHKINQLKIIQIPNENGAAFNYCELAESAGGVTEKVSLISLSKVTSQLTTLVTTAPTTVQDYLDHRNDYKLSTQAILKLPKHGKIEEVQRESLALNFSRLSGLDTTQSSMVMYNGKPTLFVPFDDIRLLKDFAHGKVFKSGLTGSQTYEHYSTIDPVGSGLQSNVFIQDFGKSLGVFYLCSDPDFVGGYNQNKALRNSKSLFMFDMVVMPGDKLKLDSRLSLQPNEFLVKHTRHGQGRNRTLIEDSAFHEKFNSLLTVMRNENRMLAYLDLTISRHAAHIEQLKKSLDNATSSQAKEIKSEIKQVAALQKDAELIRQSVKNRISRIPETFPGSEKISYNGMAKGLILEKLLNNPALFNDEGRPYRNPWTYRNETQLTYMKFLPGQDHNGDKVLLAFSSIIPPQMVSFIKRHGAPSLTIVPHRNEFELTHMTISVKELAALQETMLYPETHLEGLLPTDYLNLSDLQAIGNAYGEGHRTRIISLMQEYKQFMAQTGVNEPSVQSKLKAINSVDADLLEFINTAKDKGFAMHVRKKMQFDIQQQLRGMIPAKELPDNLDEAFSAALKLDQINTFNRVMETAIETKKWNSPEFKKFLQACINQYQGATDHHLAIDASRNVAKAGGETMNAFRMPLKAVLAPVSKGSKSEDDHLDDIDPLIIQQQQLKQQQEKLEKSVSMDNTNSEEEVEHQEVSPTTVSVEVK
ncbi:hypothetical protein DIZ81_09415 [Legionella taurinensis]|uniref:Coiled-coil protein n=1 Tax=Legionella taurinensis TaxID=70611 RepID=A0AB38N3H5_9GAMM|nr:hypothetical protein [Legionella taurinensis]MDX1838061.1 hypothetical protein [Legionella taurinensis]PUT39356.1 hypothetical protein DB744_09425 [Legionella taurinensis]PUT41665.1 hypothetical protein DB746_08340 [Legionella taurinensis]PUT44499.1 hypothetical protein DB743_07555 [Legionella taurinensis]PUT46743.1 hypothetical protein DB745_09420 [Legionella taurinensis]